MTLKHGLCWFALATGLACSSFTRLAAPSDQMSAYQDVDRRGFYRFIFDEFHSLNTDAMDRSAVAWKVIAAAAVNHHRRSDATMPRTEQAYIDLLVKRYGFVVPKRIANWPEGVPQPTFTRPIGMVSGQLTSRIPSFSLEVSNNGCSTCHSAVLYDAQGQPTRDVWIGLPSSSVNFGRYATELFQSFEHAIKDTKALEDTIRAMFPKVQDQEIATIYKHYLPVLKKRIPRLSAAIGGFTPYSNGAPGLTNGVATIKFYLGVIGDKRYDESQVAFTSIPDLGGLAQRTSVLSDGVYSPPGWSHTGALNKQLTPAQHRDGIAGVITLVTVGTLGVQPRVAVQNIPRMKEVIGDLFEHYRPPPFPGPIDKEQAALGAQIFTKRCASCHGTYTPTDQGYRLSDYPNHLVKQDLIETDPERWQAVGKEANELFGTTALGPHIDAQRMEGYIALPLTSIWATSPYLHNGSIPTLWHLMHPKERPARFQVGGHALDFEKMGIAGVPSAKGDYLYPDGYQPWSLPTLYDTSQAGKGNGGHSAMFAGLSDEQKMQLIEFLKQL